MSFVSRSVYWSFFMNQVLRKSQPPPVAVEQAARQRRQLNAQVLGGLATGKWLQPLADLLTAERAAYAGKPRARPKWLKYADVDFSPDLQTAFAVLHVVMRGEVQRPRHNLDDDGNKEWNPPVMAVIAQHIGEALGAPERDRFAVGQRLLQHAAELGLIESLTPQCVDGGRHSAVRVRLSPAAAADVQGLTAALLARLGNPELSTEPPVYGPVTVERIISNPFGKIEPPTPEGTAVADALQVIDSTKWRVNQYMLAALTDLEIADRQHKRELPTNAEQAAIAQAWVAPDEFYFRSRFDFRGRVYSSGGFALQYTGGSDLIRSLLEFADGEPLTPIGRKWLAVHLTNCWAREGIQNLPDDEREKYVAEHRARFIAYAEDPLGTVDKWREAKEPYRFLAACDALRRDRDGLPVHLPCAVDATCSGLQVYAWLMRDADLAKRVNLLPGAYEDFYSHVATEAGLECDRPTAKQVIVPMMYGGGQPDARRRLEQGGRSKAEATALVKAIYRKTDELAPAAKTLRAAFKEVARAFTERGAVVEWSFAPPKPGESKPRKKEAGYADSLPIYWRTPSGFRCVLDSRIQKKTRLRYLVGPPGNQKERAAVLRVGTETVNAKKQRQGFGVGVIHSLDASVLIASVNRGANQGIQDWALAHDSYAVHPNRGAIRFDVLRQAAKETFAGDYLADLWEQFRQQAGDSVPPMPEHSAALPADFGEGVGMYR